MQRTLIIIILTVILLPTITTAEWVEHGTVVSTSAEMELVVYNQNYIHSASDGAGGLIMLWSDTRDSAQSLYAQRIDSSGNIVWASDVLISTSLGAQSDVHIQPDGTGGAFIAWIDEQHASQVLLSRINTEGNFVWDPQVISTGPLATVIPSLDIALDNEGGVFLFWAQVIDAGSYDIKGQWVGANGTLKWPVDGAPICVDPEYQTDVKAISSGWNTIITWRDWRDGNAQAYAQRIHLNQSGFASPQWETNGIRVSSDSYAINDVETVTTLDGGAIFSWIDDTIARMSRYDASGFNYWGHTIVVNSTNYPPTAEQLKIVSDGADGAIATWIDGHNGIANSIYAQRISASGNRVWAYDGVPVCQTGSTTDLDGIIALPDGGLFVAWTGNGSLSAQRLSSYGAPLWALNGIPVRSYPSEVLAAHMIDDGTGGVILGWADHRADSYTSMPYAQRLELTQGTWGHPEPTVVSVVDVPGDQGGNVFVNWDASGRDVLISPDTVTHYSVWRAFSPAARSEAPLSNLPIIDPASVAPDHKEPVVWIEETSSATLYWAWMGNQDAYRLAAYSYMSPTSHDSISGDPAEHAFMVLAHSADPTLFWESNSVTGYSIDNLAPATPVTLTPHAIFSPQELELSWLANLESDLSTYSIYRELTPDFTPAPGNLITTTVDTMFTDTGWTQAGNYYYKISAIDVHGNESEFAMLAPDGVSAVGEAPKAFRFYGNHPNPFNPSTTIAFDLPENAMTSLRVYDLGGRLVRTLVDQSSLPAGHYSVTWHGLNDAGRKVSTGVYLYRIEAGSFKEMSRMTLVK
jgi:hypothetical protein